MNNNLIYNVIEQGDVNVSGVIFDGENLDIYHDALTGIVDYDHKNKTFTLFTHKSKITTVIQLGNFKSLRVMTNGMLPYKTTLKFC